MKSIKERIRSGELTFAQAVELAKSGPYSLTATASTMRKWQKAERAYHMERVS